MTSLILFCYNNRSCLFQIPDLSKILLKSTAIVSSMTFISRIFGMLRDIVIARIFASGFEADVFFLVMRIPGVLQSLLSEGGFTKIFVPVLIEYKHTKSHEKIRDLIDHTYGTLIFVLLAIITLGMFLAPVIVIIFAPGFWESSEKYTLAIDMFRLTLPYVFFIILAGFSSSIINTYGKFALPAFIPVIRNISLIVCAIYLSPMMQQPIKALAWGVLIAGILQLLIQLPTLNRFGCLPKIKYRRQHEGVNRILKSMVPIFFIASISHINIIVDSLMASFLVTGSISWLYYSQRLIQFPVGVFGIALATVVLPKLSSKFSQNTGFSELLDNALHWIFLISIPATIGLMVLSEAIIITIFQYGAFDLHSVYMTNRSLWGYALGIPGLMLVAILMNSHFSRRKTTPALRAAIIALVTNVVLNLIFIGFLKHAGLALASSLSAFVQVGLLFYYLKKEQAYTPKGGWRIFVLRIIIAGLCMGALLLFLLPDSAIWATWGGLTRALNLLFWIVCGVLLYTLVLLLSGMRVRHLMSD